MRALILTLAIGLVPIAAAAQPADDAAPDLAPAAQSSQGPMTVERIHNGFLAAPDFKATKFDHRTDGLAGGYAGVVFADAFFVGAGGYGLVTNTHGRNLAYGGLVMQWFGRSNDTFGYSAKMLVGAGTADTTENVQVIVDRAGHTATQPIRMRQDFAVFEPEITGLVRFNRHLRLTAGVGYRFTGSDWRNRGVDGFGRINPDGVTGTVGLQISSGS
jgi:hypothetical protein